MIVEGRHARCGLDEGVRSCIYTSVDVMAGRDAHLPELEAIPLSQYCMLHISERLLSLVVSWVLFRRWSREEALRSSKSCILQLASQRVSHQLLHLINISNTVANSTTIIPCSLFGNDGRGACHPTRSSDVDLSFTFLPQP